MESEKERRKWDRSARSRSPSPLTSPDASVFSLSATLETPAKSQKWTLEGSENSKNETTSLVSTPLPLLLASASKSQAELLSVHSFTSKDMNTRVAEDIPSDLDFYGRSKLADAKD